MTIDSAYYVKFSNVHSGVNYIYPQESIGEEALQLWTGSPGSWTQLTYDVDFEWTFGGEEPMYNAAQATFDEPLSSNIPQVLFMRRTPITNEVTFEDNTEFDGNMFEYAIDKITMILQEIDGHKQLCLVLPDPAGPEPACDALEYGLGTLSPINLSPCNDMELGPGSQNLLNLVASTPRLQSPVNSGWLYREVGILPGACPDKDYAIKNDSTTSPTNRVNDTAADQTEWYAALEKYDYSMGGIFKADSSSAEPNNFGVLGRRIMTMTKNGWLGGSGVPTDQLIVLLRDSGDIDMRWTGYQTSLGTYATENWTISGAQDIDDAHFWLVTSQAGLASTTINMYKDGLLIDSHVIGYSRQGSGLTPDPVNDSYDLSFCELGAFSWMQYLVFFDRELDSSEMASIRLYWLANVPP